MAKALPVRSLTIFLLKAGIKASDALDNEAAEDCDEADIRLAHKNSGTLYTKQTPITPPSWAKFFAASMRVRNPEQDDRLLRQLFYSAPVLGNLLNVSYVVWKRLDPSIEDRLHQRINRFTHSVDSWRRFRTMGIITVVIFAVGAVTVLAWLS